VRQALLTQPRAAVDLHAAPPPVRAAAAQFEDALEVQVRRVLVGSQPHYEILATFAFEEDEADDAEPRQFVSGLIIDAAGTELVDLDFEQGVATFALSPEQKAADERLAQHLERLFTQEALQTQSVKAKQVPMPKALVESIDGEEDTGVVYAVEHADFRGFAKVFSNDGSYEVLVFDAKHRPLGGTPEVGVEPFDLASFEDTAPLAPAPAAAGESKGNDVFEGARRPKVVF
jgi:hypothetical protein